MIYCDTHFLNLLSGQLYQRASAQMLVLEDIRTEGPLAWPRIRFSGSIQYHSKSGHDESNVYVEGECDQLCRLYQT